VAGGGDGAVFGCFAHGAARFGVVAAVAEAALVVVGEELGEAPFQFQAVHRPQAVFPHARRVDDGRAVGQGVNGGRGGGVDALAGDLRQRAGALVQVRNECVEQRGLADAGLAREQAGALGEQGAQLVKLWFGLAARAGDAIPEVGEVVELAEGRAGGQRQVGLVDDHHRLDALDECRGQVAVDQVGAGRRVGRDDDHRPVDVGRRGPEPAASVAASEFVAARPDFGQFVAPVEQDLVAGQRADQSARKMKRDEAVVVQPGNAAVGPGLDHQARTIQCRAPRWYSPAQAR